MANRKLAYTLGRGRAYFLTCFTHISLSNLICESIHDHNITKYPIFAYMCRRRWCGCGWAGCPAGLPKAVDYVHGLRCGVVALQCATAAAALSVSKLLKSDSSQAFLLLSCCCAAWMSRASANVPIISLHVFVLSRSGVVLCWCAVFLLLCFYT